MKKFSKCVGKMRVSLMTLAVVFCCAMVASVFSACSSSDDDNSKEQDSGKATSARVFVKFLQTEDMLKYCDVSVEYNDGTGAKTEKVTDASWQKTLDAKLPATITFKRTVTLKNDVDLSAIKSFKYSTQYYDGYCLLNASNAPLDELIILPLPNGNQAAVSRDDVAALLEQGHLNNTLTYSFDANGNKK